MKRSGPNVKRGGPKKKLWHNGLFWAGLVVVVLLAALWVPAWFTRGQLPREGQVIADFTLPDAQGQTFQLSQAYKENPLILVFYRGYA